MDLGEVENGKRTGSTKKENNGVVRHFPLRSLSVDGNMRYDLRKTQYSYERQNSINNSKDYNELKDRKDLVDHNSGSCLQNHNSTSDKVTEDVIKDTYVAVAYNVNETSNTSASEKLLGKDINLIKDSRMAEPMDAVFEESECSEKLNVAGNGGPNRQSRATLYRLTICCITLLLCCAGLLIFVFIKVFMNLFH